ncbi:major capsid protein [Roseomonas indoligenes]|uniref:Major capsid protein n=1 Tax=Roseomonas indoligenes TaxID=2820811 RepID=A0A940MWM5_9PROT|nr:major capsid protein [Pararoseomonas indoligenes]MBP0492174.1 major capsid protein [Pararoseomonas indoligenes]
MAISMYDTVALIRVVENVFEPSQFLLDTFFPNTVQSDTEYVAIDVLDGQRRLAPFVNPLQEGKLVEQLGIRTPTFKPPYLKPKVRIDPTRPLRRSLGERVGGDMTPMEREAINLRFELEEQIRMINRRLEWMAGRAMADGALTVVGEGVPQTSINFGRDAALNVTLSGANRWGQSGVSPVSMIETWGGLVLQKSGYPVTDVVFTPSAWAYFRADPRFAQIVASLANGIPGLQAAGVVAQTGGQLLGQWGQFRLWLYYDFYVDPVDNQQKPTLPDGTVLMGSRNIDGVRAFATIIDTEIGYPSIPYAPKSWVTHDPGARWLMTQSAPLVIPSRVNASFAAMVI